MPLKLPVAHDFLCPWCWIGMLQIARLKINFDLEIEWLSYELWPVELDWPEPTAATPPPANKPTTPTRFDFISQIEGIVMPTAVRPKRMRTHNAHEAVEFMKSTALVDEFVFRLYSDYWQHGKVIDDVDYLVSTAAEFGADPAAIRTAIESKQFADRIVGFDDPAYASGVYNVPTFFIGGQRYAEQPYDVLHRAIQDVLGERAEQIYGDLKFPPAPSYRPYILINMVATIDGKILSGERDESVHDLGSEIDHQLMKRIESKVDAVLVGASTLRATSGAWHPKPPVRVVLTQSGKLDFSAGFFRGGRTIVLCPESTTLDVPEGIEVWRSGNDSVNLWQALRELQEKASVSTLLALGGSELNALLLKDDLVDELFLTVAPKVKLGRDVPTYADGEPLAREDLLHWDIAEQHRVGNELFLRYRRHREESDEACPL
jgi:riboflavin biosynthesis pyrimidine reductase/predicted DsbA family dithiol-disulfide isomerase